MPDIKAICFDLDSTLLDEIGLNEAVASACETVVSLRPQLAAGGLASINGQVFRTYWRETEEDALLGRVTGDEISREVWRLSLSAAGIEDASVTDTTFEVFTREVTKSYRLFSDALPVLETLRNRFPLALITNGPSDVQHRKLEATGLDQYFAAVLISADIGMIKPDAAIFHRAAKLLDVAPDAMLHVADSLTADVAGALNAGSTAVWLNRSSRTRRPSDPDPHHEITSLAELRELLP